MNQGILIRPIRDSDCRAIAYISNTYMPEPTTEEDVREAIAGDQGAEHPVERLVAELDGRVAGLATYGRADWVPPDHYFIRVVVGMPHRRQGLGAKLYEIAYDKALASGCVAVDSSCRGDDDASFEWALRRGFALERWRTESVLDLAAWRPDDFTPAIERVRSSGLGIVVVDRSQVEPYWRGLYEIEARTMNDCPSMDTETPPTYESWLQQQVSSTGRWIYAMALAGDLMVGCTSISLPRTEGQSASVHYTGVLREYRGRGIATAIKAASTTEAARAGVSKLRTNNDRDNPPIMAANVKMGFREVPGPRMLRKQLSSEECAR